jgi:hypothetical protein
VRNLSKKKKKEKPNGGIRLKPVQIQESAHQLPILFKKCRKKKLFPGQMRKVPDKTNLFGKPCVSIFRNGNYSHPLHLGAFSLSLWIWTLKTSWTPLLSQP